MNTDDVDPVAARVARDRDVLLRLLSVTASLAGLCIAALGFLEASDRPALENSYADELIAIDALLFVGCVYLILWALRTRSPVKAHRLSRVVDVVFLFALTSLLLAAAYIIYWVL
ncbi:MAG: hypothetical protein U1F15_03635 [Burkholderiales bacterium]